MEDDDPEALYATVGHLISAWASAEDVVFSIFIVALTGKFSSAGNFHPFHAAYHSTRAFEPRLRMVDAAFKTQFQKDEPILEAWKPLVKRLYDASTERNTVAHHVVQTSSVPGRWVLAPAFWKDARKPAPGMDLEDVKKIEERIVSVHMDLHAFFLAVLDEVEIKGRPPL